MNQEKQKNHAEPSNKITSQGPHTSHGQLIDPAKMREYIPLEAGAGGGGRFSPDTVTAMVARQPLVEPARRLRGYGERRWLGGWGKQQGWQVRGR